MCYSAIKWYRNMSLTLNFVSSFFPAQNGSDNLKEGFEMGPSGLSVTPEWARKPINLTEANIWPAESSAPGLRQDIEKLHGEPQDLLSKLLSLLAIALGKEPSNLEPYLDGSVSTLRYLHYPAIKPPSPQQELCCTSYRLGHPHTLLHQDSTGGLEVFSPDGIWVAVPYAPGSFVMNIGDLMAKVSGGRFQAMYHLVRSSPGKDRYIVPFFFEPGVDCAVYCVEEADQAVIYGEHVLGKMQGWVEFQDLDKNAGIAVDVAAIDPEIAW